MKDIRTIKSLLLFLGITFFLTWSVDFLIINGFEIEINTMFCPGIAAVIIKILFYRNEAVLGLRLCGTKYIVLSFLIPLIYFGASYGIFLFFNKDSFTGEVYTRDAAALIMIFISSLVSAAGEEIGWRGFLLPRLAGVLDFKKAAVISGLIWSLWHFPILIYYLSESLSMWFQLAMFTAEITLIGVIMAYFRFASKSVFPAIVLHASHNYFDQIIFGPMTSSPVASYYAGETGVITLVLVLATLLLISGKNRGSIYLQKE